MDLEWWQCRNLARIVLSRAYREAVLHLVEDIKQPEESPVEEKATMTENDGRQKTVRMNEVPSVAYYNRYDEIVAANNNNINKDPTVIYHIPTFVSGTPSAFNELIDIRWPISAHMSPLVGKRAIIDFISKKWKFSERIHFVVDFICMVHLHGVNKYKYCSRWSNGFVSSRVYFTLDASATNPAQVVTMKFFLPDGKRAHRPTTSHEHFERFIKYLNSQKHNNYIIKY